MTQKHLSTAIDVYLMEGDLYMDFVYRRCRSSLNGETAFGDSYRVDSVLVERGVEGFELVPPASPKTLFQRFLAAIRPRPCTIIAHKESGSKKIAVSEVFATKCIFERRGIADTWIVEHPRREIITPHSFSVYP